eukprot:TCALIF_12252-PA protein Name:"Protein of unknown function" AED:0.46 eAED:0.46 QI:0/0.5/0.33/0.66/0/0/3/72/110
MRAMIESMNTEQTIMDKARNIWSFLVTIRLVLSMSTLYNAMAQLPMERWAVWKMEINPMPTQNCVPKSSPKGMGDSRHKDTLILVNPPKIGEHHLEQVQTHSCGNQQSDA